VLSLYFKEKESKQDGLPPLHLLEVLVWLKTMDFIDFPSLSFPLIIFEQKLEVLYFSSRLSPLIDDPMQLMLK
jgi:hypothetical protein